MDPSQWNLHQLRVFHVIAQNESVSRAAQVLHLSQPAVSMHLRQLEQQVGLPLVQRAGRGIRLTEAGRELFLRTQRLFALLQETGETLEAIKGVRRGSLRVAADTTAGVYVVPAYLGRFHRAHPEVSVSLHVDNRSAIVQVLQADAADLAVLGQVPPHAGLEAEPFLPNELVVVAWPGHPLLRHEPPVPLAEIARQPVLLREPGSGTRATTEQYFAMHGLPLQPAMELGSNSAIKQAVAHGLGVAVLSRHAVQLELETGRLAIVPAEGFPLVRQWHVVYRSGRELSPAAQAFRMLLLRGGPAGRAQVRSRRPSRRGSSTG